MSRLFRTLPLALLVVAAATPAASALAQTPGLVRVGNNAAPIRRWFRAGVQDVLVMVPPGTILDVLDQERDHYWVVAPPDAHGTRRAGWIRTNVVSRLSPRVRRVPAPARRGSRQPGRRQRQHFAGQRRRGQGHDHDPRCRGRRRG
jgi:hypothetical protein